MSLEKIINWNKVSEEKRIDLLERPTFSIGLVIALHLTPGTVSTEISPTFRKD